MELYVELILLVLLGLLAALLTWTYGYIQTARALAVMASVGLLITALGAGILLWFYYVEVPSQAGQIHGLNLLAGAFVFIVFILGGGLEAFGAVWTLALCLIGLRRHAGGRVWFVALLIGGLTPLVATTLAILFTSTLTAFFTQLVGSDTAAILGVSPSAASTVCAALTPLIAAIVTTADAVHSAAQRHRVLVKATVG